MAGVYRPRHPECTVLYRVLFQYFDQFLAEYESRFEKEYGFLRPIIKDVVERYLDCGNPRCGFARIRCPDCGPRNPTILKDRLWYLTAKGQMDEAVSDMKLLTEIDPLDLEGYWLLGHLFYLLHKYEKARQRSENDNG